MPLCSQPFSLVAEPLAFFVSLEHWPRLLFFSRFMRYKLLITSRVGHFFTSAEVEAQTQ